MYVLAVKLADYVFFGPYFQAFLYFIKRLAWATLFHTLFHLARGLAHFYLASLTFVWHYLKNI